MSERPWWRDWRQLPPGTENVPGAGRGLDRSDVAALAAWAVTTLLLVVAVASDLVAAWWIAAVPTIVFSSMRWRSRRRLERKLDAHS